MLGTNEIKDVIKTVADGYKVGAQVLKDGGKINVAADLPLVLKLVQDLPALVSGIDQVPAQLADIDATEAADLVAFTMAELALEEGKAKSVLDAALKILADAVVLVKAITA